MNNFAEYITPAKAHELNPDRSVKQYEKQARNHSTCQCGQEKVWKYGGCDLCFSCTTGEADASDDYELV
jgi:hypothetical protein